MASNDDKQRCCIVTEYVNGCDIHYEINAKQQFRWDRPSCFCTDGVATAGIYSGIVYGCDAGSATLIALDFPAHGQSEEPPEPWGVGELCSKYR